MKRILFVCTGNTCRSPMAEAILRKKANHIEIKSAGIFAILGSSASVGAIEALQEKGIILEHESKPFTQDLADWSSIILTMTKEHKRMIITHYPDVKDKVYTLSEFTNENNEDTDIMDPFGGSTEIYKHTANEIEGLLEKILQKNIIDPEK